MRIIFKVLDDLRQDQLVLNILRQMDSMWKEDPKVGDLYVTPYAVVPTWEEGGVVQVSELDNIYLAIVYVYGLTTRL